MEKPQKLRKMITELLPEFQSNPDKLQLYYSNGKMHATGGESLSFEYEYDLEIYITEFNKSPDILLMIINNFIRDEQPELVRNTTHDGQVTFEVEPLNDESFDIFINLPLTERVIVENNDNNFTIHHAPEPKLDDGLRNIKITFSGPHEKEMTLSNQPDPAYEVKNE